MCDEEDAVFMMHEGLWLYVVFLRLPQVQTLSVLINYRYTFEGIIATILS